jgi:hypothetical protein
MRTKQPTTKSSAEPTRTEPRSAASPGSRELGLAGPAFELFLEFPVPVVILVLWMAGVVFFGACALLTYVGISALVEMVRGAF